MEGVPRARYSVVMPTDPQAREWLEHWRDETDAACKEVKAAGG